VLVLAGAAGLWRACDSGIPLGWIAVVAAVVVGALVLPTMSSAAPIIDSWWASPIFVIRNAIFALPIAAVAWCQLLLVDPIFLRLGSYRRLRRLAKRLTAEHEGPIRSGHVPFDR